MTEASKYRSHRLQMVFTLIERSALTVHQRLLLLTLAHRAGTAGVVQITLSDLAAMCGSTSPTMRRTLLGLEDIGWLTVDRDPRIKWQGYKYTINHKLLGISEFSQERQGYTCV